MKPFDKLSELKIENKEFFATLFKGIVNKVQNNEFKIEFGEKEYSTHYIITDKRLDSIFINIVPKQAYTLFIQMPKTFTGFTVLTGKHNNQEVRVSCFGIECSILAKSLIKKEN